MGSSVRHMSDVIAEINFYDNLIRPTIFIDPCSTALTITTKVGPDIRIAWCLSRPENYEMGQS